MDLVSFSLSEEQTKDICLWMVKMNGLSLEEIKIQTEEICLEAVKENPFAVFYVEEPFIEKTIQTLRLRSFFDEDIKEALDYYYRLKGIK